MFMRLLKKNVKSKKKKIKNGFLVLLQLFFRFTDCFLTDVSLTRKMILLSDKLCAYKNCKRKDRQK